MLKLWQTLNGILVEKLTKTKSKFAVKINTPHGVLGRVVRDRSVELNILNFSIPKCHVSKCLKTSTIVLVPKTASDKLPQWLQASVSNTNNHEVPGETGPQIHQSHYSTYFGFMSVHRQNQHQQMMPFPSPSTPHHRLKPQGTYNTTVGQDGPPRLLHPLTQHRSQTRLCF